MLAALGEKKILRAAHYIFFLKGFNRPSIIPYLNEEFGLKYVGFTIWLYKYGAYDYYLNVTFNKNAPKSLFINTRLD